MDNQEKQSKEQQILAAAEQEFLTRGYDGARTTSIAQAAGVTHAMLHYYFRTKEQLFKRIVDEKFETMSHSMFAIMGDPSLPIVERIKGGIEAHFDFVAQNPLLPRFVINEIISRPERYDVLYKRVGAIIDNVYRGLQSEINRSAERGEIERVDIKAHGEGDVQAALSWFKEQPPSDSMQRAMAIGPSISSITVLSVSSLGDAAST